MRNGKNVALVESINRERDTKIKDYKKRFKGQFAALESSPKAKSTIGIMEEDYFILGQQLDQAVEMKRIAESLGDVTALNVIPQVALDVITFFYGLTPLNLIASVQPIPDQFGIIYIKQLIAQTTRGNVTAGDLLATPLGLPAEFPQGFASNMVSNFLFLNDAGASGLTSGSYTNQSFLGGNALSSPVDLRNINIYGFCDFTSHAGVAFGTPFNGSGNKMYVGADGTFSQVAQLPGGVEFTLYGKINAANGTVTLSFPVVPIANVKFYIDYSVLMEQAADVQTVIIDYDKRFIQSQDYTLKTGFGILEQFTAQKRLGVDIAAQSIEALTTLMNQELMYKALALLVANIPSANTTTWGQTAPSGISYFEHKQSLFDAWAKSNAHIYASAMRGNANVWIAGNMACSIIETLQGFVMNSMDDSYGPHIFGSINGKTIIRVPAGFVLGDYQMVGLYKGKSGSYDAPLVWAPYQPLTITELLPTGANLLQRQQGAVMQGGMASIVPNLSTNLTITPASNDAAFV